MSRKTFDADKPPDKPTHVSWAAEEARKKEPRIEQWVFFGVALIIAVASLLFAAATWAVQSHRTSSATAEANSLAVELDETKRDLKQQLEEARAELDKVAAQAEEHAERVTELEENNSSLEDSRSLLGGEVASLKREVEAITEDLERCQSIDMNPGELPPASLADAIADTTGFAISVNVHDPGRRAQISEGALIQFTSQRLRRSGIPIDDDSSARVIVDVFAETGNGRTLIQVHLRVLQRWKVPGREAMRPVTIWNLAFPGTTSPERAATLVEEMIGELVSSLADDVQDGR